MWPFTRRLPETQTFSTNQAFFDDQCLRASAKVRAGEGRAAMVLDARLEIGAPVPVQVDEYGVQTVMLLVVSPDGGFLVAARTPSAVGEPLLPGDLVFWEPIDLNDTLSAAAADARSGLMGVVRCKLRPELTDGEDFSVQAYYD